MYADRFRSRETLGISKAVKVLELSRISGGCDLANPITWHPYYTGTDSTFRAFVENIDDVTGDSPRPSLGVAGYKFHPLTHVKVTFEGANGEGAYTIRAVNPDCSGLPGEYKRQYSRIPSGYASAHAWSTLAIPMIGNRVNLGLLPLPSARISDLMTLAETSTLNERGRFGESNLFESIGEVDKTLGMLKDIFQRAHRIYHDAFLGKRGLSRVRALSDEAAGQYLLTRYGFKPLLADIEAVLLGLEKPLGRRLKTTRQTESWSDKQTSSLPLLNVDGNWSVGRTLNTSDELSVRSMSLDHVDLTLMRNLGLGYKDLITVPWELKSHSFIVDWFANIGDFLGALVPDVGISNIGMCSTVRWVRKDQVVFSSMGVAPGRVDIELLSGSVPPPITRTIEYTRRTVGRFVPGLRWQSDFKFDKLTRSLDALALLSAAAKRVTKANPGLSPAKRLAADRRRNPSQRGRRDAADFFNLTD
jgi:hypothetical protein